MSDHLFVRGSRKLVRAHAASTSARTYAYEFGWASTAFDGALGASHLVELPFVFGQLALPSLRGPRGLLGPGPVPGQLARRMRSAWVRFAATGDPGAVPADGPLRLRRLNPDPPNPPARHRHGPTHGRRTPRD
jgi:para-nitrobenzyl esterase